MNRKSYLNFDFIILSAVICLVTISISFIYSSGMNAEGVNTSNEYLKQLIWGCTGLILMLTVIFIDYKLLYDFSAYIYIFCNILLLITVLFGNKVNGARSWLGFMGFGIQPSEFAKLGTIIFLAAYCAKNKKEITSLLVFIKALGIIALPMMLILAQPDMGTTLVFIPIFLAILLIAGAKIRYLFFIAAGGFLTMVLTVIPVWTGYIQKQESYMLNILMNTAVLFNIFIAGIIIAVLAGIGWHIYKKGYYYWLCYGSVIFSGSIFCSIAVRKVIKVYQIMRLAVFLDPSVDPKGAGWNIIQSITAIGSGGFWGKGFLQGTQSHYQYLPMQSNDFIFSIIAEESGFLGCMLVFLCFFIILMRGLIIACAAKDSFGTYMAFGIIAMIFFHFMINIGMAMGIMPITGIPLLFLSYGGSSLWTSMIAVGILINIYYRRYGFKI